MRYQYPQGDQHKDQEVSNLDNLKHQLTIPNYRWIWTQRWTECWAHQAQTNTKSIRNSLKDIHQRNQDQLPPAKLSTQRAVTAWITYSKQQILPLIREMVRYWNQTKFILILRAGILTTFSKPRKTRLNQSGRLQQSDQLDWIRQNLKLAGEDSWLEPSLMLGIKPEPGKGTIFNRKTAGTEHRFCQLTTEASKVLTPRRQWAHKTSDRNSTWKW